METPLAWYTQNCARYKEAILEKQQNYSMVSLLRLASFVIFAVAGYQWISKHTIAWLLAALFFAVLFFILVRIAFRLKDQKALLEKLLYINNNEINILQYQPNQFDDGQSFASNDDFSSDLDVFGPGSLFHLLNRTSTYHGKKTLASLLQNPVLSKKAIEEQQQAIHSLNSQKELRQQLTAHGLLHEEKEGNLYDIQKWLQLPPILHHLTWVRLVRFILPTFNIAAIAYYFITDIYFPVILGALLSWMVISVFVKRLNHQHNLLGKKQSILDQYAAILTNFSKIETGSSVLLQQQRSLARAAHQTIKQLSTLSSLFDQRLNMVVNFFLNSLFMYEIHCLWALENWKAASKDKFAEWIHCVGTIESLNSLATFAFNNPEFSYPEVREGELVISATQLAHPLIPANERVANDFTIGRQEQLALVTGSNMSGKTTFLRALGVNLLLGQCGAPVCASSFSFSPMTLHTSIRVSDSLQEHTSYFMAELKRLQQIIKHLQTTTHHTLVLIDEILRGTNSEDKTHGSEQFIRKLLQYRCLTLFATHDLALSRLENELPGNVSNYCFESVIRHGELLFDYTLQKGVAQNKNASFLMQKMEII